MTYRSEQSAIGPERFICGPMRFASGPKRFAKGRKCAASGLEHVASGHERRTGGKRTRWILDAAEPASPQPAHPSVQRLHAYLVGKLDEAASQRIDTHLEQCSQCCESLAELVSDEPLVDQLRVAEQSVPTFPHGRRIGDYRLLSVIGQGGMGIVFEAFQESLARRVALKLLPIARAHDVEAVRRFHREARAVANLHHTNIVPIYEIGEADECQYYAMQLVSGRSLAQLYAELRDADEPAGDAHDADLDRELRARSIAHMGYQAASALAHAHARGVIHRDVKPSNLLLDDEGVVWVVDFGLAKFDDDDLTASGQLIGTLRYLSPERFRGQADERGDIYALGVTLYELLVRRRLFESTDRLQSMDRIINHVPSPPRRIDPSIPKDLETIVLKAITKDPQQRYQTAAEMADDLLRFYDQEQILARRLRSPGRLSYTIRSNPLASSLVGALIMMLVLGGVMLAGYVSHLRATNQRLAHALLASGVATEVVLRAAREPEHLSPQRLRVRLDSQLVEAAAASSSGAHSVAPQALPSQHPEAPLAVLLEIPSLGFLSRLPPDEIWLGDWLGETIERVSIGAEPLPLREIQIVEKCLFHILGRADEQTSERAISLVPNTLEGGSVTVSAQLDQIER